MGAHIIKALKHLIVWFKPDPDRNNPSAHGQNEFFVSIGLVTSIFTLSYMGVSYGIDFLIGIALQTLCFALLIATFMLFRATGHYRLCTHLFLGNCFFVSIFGCSFFSGGIYSMVTPWFVLAPIASVLLHQKRFDTLLWGTLACLAIAGYGISDIAGYPLPTRYNLELQPFFHTLCVFGLAIFLTWIAFIFGQNRSQSMATISAQKESLESALAEIEQLAFHDPLTRLPNRRLLMDRLKQARAESARHKTYAALLFMDLDNFKALNDSHGHEAGDLLLNQAAERLASSLRKTDTIARFGGDEFAILLNELGSDFELARQYVQTTAEKISTVLAKPYQLALDHGNKTQYQVEHLCTASIGIVLFYGDMEEEKTLLILADEAMYAAKASGGNKVFMHTQHDPARSKE